MARRTSTIFALGSLALVAFFAISDLAVLSVSSHRNTDSPGSARVEMEPGQGDARTLTVRPDFQVKRSIEAWDGLLRRGPIDFSREELAAVFAATRGDLVRFARLPDHSARVAMVHLHEDGTRSVGLAFSDFPGAIAYLQRESDGTTSGHLLWDEAEAGIELRQDDAGELIATVRATERMMCSRSDGNIRRGGLPRAAVAEEAAVDPSRSGGSGGGIPLLQSDPGASRTIYLDFDGETVTGTSWNLQYNDGDPIVAAPYGNPAAIESIWRSIAEDYRVFNVNVTTDRSVFDATNGRNRCMVIFTPSRDWYGNAGGVAYTRSFGTSVNNMCWSFNAGANAAAESGSHEAGHQMGLNHDGTSVSSYYSGHIHPGSRIGWAPIMGLSYGKNISQFSKGEYSGADEKQDDLDVVGNILGNRPDDFADTRQSAVAPNDLGQGRIDLEGFIGSGKDVDCILLPLIRSGGISVTVTPASSHTNLDIKISLTDEAGSLVATSAPDNTFAATIRTGTLVPGKYFLTISGSALGTPANGYPAYGSVGGYKITGTCPPVGPASTPGGFEASDGTLTTHVQLGWEADALATSYRVYRSSNSIFSSYQPIAEVSVPRYEDSATALDTVYRYHVTSVNPLGESAPTPMDTGFRQNVPDMAVNLVASDLRYTTHTRLEWKAAARASGYRVFRNRTASTAGAIEIGTTSGTAFDDHEGFAGENYYYFVRSFNAAGEAGVLSFDSGSRSAAFEAPVSVNATRGDFEGGVSVSFSATPGATRYTIFRSEGNDPREARLVGTTAAFEYYDRTAEPGRTYTYHVRAEGLNGDSALSDGATGSIGARNAEDDSFEANDRIEEAYPLAAYEGQWLGPRADSAVALDADWFELVPGIGAERLDVILSPSAGAQVGMSLIDEGGNLLASAEPVGPALAISHRITAAGRTYFLLVESESRASAGYNLLWRSVTAGGSANRSDLVIGGTPASVVGRFIFESTARSQKVRSLVKGTRTVKSFASAVNEGVDPATIAASGSRSDGWVRFTHIARVGSFVRNLSAAMRLGGVEQDLAPLDSVRFEIRTKPSKKAAKRRSSVSGVFTTSVSGVAGTRDSGRFVYPIRKR